MDILTPEQCRAARGLLDMKQTDLATMAGVGVSSIKNYEAGRIGKMVANNMLAIRRVFEKAGVEFLPENESGPGVRLEKGKDARAWQSERD